MKQNIVIIDYGMGNLRSVENKFRLSDCRIKISAEAADIMEADKLVLPGVGHFAQGMKNLKEKKLINVLENKVLKDKTLFLEFALECNSLHKAAKKGIAKDWDGLMQRVKSLNLILKNPF